VRSAESLNRSQSGERSKRVGGSGADIHPGPQEAQPVRPRYGVHRGMTIARSEVRVMLMNPLLLRVAH
jgi:hypothetical protein